MVIIFIYRYIRLREPLTKLPIPYMFTQLDAPSAVSTAVITDAMICSVHLMVSFLVIILAF